MGASGPTNAEILLQHHEHASTPHPVTVEEVPDQDDIEHPPPSSSAQAQPAATLPKSRKTPFDVQSEESFPALGGGPKSRSSASMPMAWGSRKPATGGAAPNDSINGRLADSTLPPPSAHAGTPSMASSSAGPAAGPANAYGGPRILTMPGKHVEQIRFAPSQMLARNQLKRPVPEVIKDVSRKFKTRLDVREGPNGSYIFEGTGTVDSVRQALKEVAQQVGSKVCSACINPYRGS